MLGMDSVTLCPAPHDRADYTDAVLGTGISAGINILRGQIASRRRSADPQPGSRLAYKSYTGRPCAVPGYSVRLRSAGIRQSAGK